MRPTNSTFSTSVAVAGDRIIEATEEALKALRGAPFSVASVLLKAVTDSGGPGSRREAAVLAWGRAVRMSSVVRARAATASVTKSRLRFIGSSFTSTGLIQVWLLRIQEANLEARKSAALRS